MKTIMITLALLLSCLILSAQEKMEIKGMLVDGETLQSLEDGHIYVEGTNIGAVSNQFGFFNLASTEIPADGILKISYVGFETVEMKVKDIKTPFLWIAMRPDIVILHEIVIYAEKPTIFTKSIEHDGRKF
jgi:hypothetical protein